MKGIYVCVCVCVCVSEFDINETSTRLMSYLICHHVNYNKKYHIYLTLKWMKKTKVISHLCHEPRAYYYYYY
jgi:hypothetical protein